MITAEWLTSWPPEWRNARVCDHAVLLNGYPFDSELFSISNGMPLVRIRDIASEETEVRYAGEVIPEAVISKGDILIGMDGDFNVALWKGQEALLNQRVCCVRPKASLDARFLAYLLPLPLKLINEFTYSTTVKHLSSFDVLKIRFPLPTIKTQSAIADYLDRETVRLDRLLAAKERVLGILSEKRRALITHTVARGLNPDTPFRDSGIPWLGMLPLHWKSVRLKFIAEVRGGLTLGKGYGRANLSEYKYLRVANVQDGWLDLSEISTVLVPENEANSCLLQPGDVLMNEGGDADKLGRGCVWQGEITPCLHQNHVFAVRPTGVLPEWLDVWTSTDGAKNYFESRSKQSTNLASISGTNIKELPVPLPPDSEQRTIVAYIKQETAKLDALREATEKTIGLLRERRAALIAAAVTGRIHIPKQ